MAFTHTRQARHPHTVPKERKCLTTLQTSRNAADRSVVPPRFAPGLSATHGGIPNGDPGVSPHRTHTGRLP